MKYCYIVILLLSFASCNWKQHQSIVKNIEPEVCDSILITYFCGNINTSKAILCRKLAAIQEEHPKNDYSAPNMELIDTFIVDKTIIEKAINLLLRNVKAPDFSEDARMYVTIKTKYGNINTLCIDCYSRAKYNNEACKLNDELLFLLRYYSGYYSWFSISNLKKLEMFGELQNTDYLLKAIEQINSNKK